MTEAETTDAATSHDTESADHAVLLEAEGISRFFGPLVAVRDVSFSVRKGVVLGFLGPNGAGKTTAMRIITGNLAPSAGRVTVAGHDLLEDARAAKARIGYLPEQPPLYRELTVDEYLDYCAALNRIPRAERRNARDRAKESCGLAGVSRRVIGNLSKGFQQRVGLAQAVIHRPDVLVLDEPTVGLDPIQIREIRALIRELGRDHGIILSTHILPEVQASCDHVQIINKGRLVLSDSIGGLSRRMQASTLVAHFTGDADAKQLESLDGVKSLERTQDGGWRIFYDPERDPTDRLVHHAVERSLGLCELVRERFSLEDIFVQLTTDEAPAAEETA
jgi:ABC-2 type transport system ATP-binding protein